MYTDCKVYGPYIRLEDNYSHVIVLKPDGSRVTISYAKYLMELHLDRHLTATEEVHHKDTNPQNNDVSNLELKDATEHRQEHATKYIDNVSAICAWCDKVFELTPKQQSERHRGRNRIHAGPFCSRRCSGLYGKQFQ